MGILNKLSHQDDIANLFGFGATITSGRWMLHILSWLENLIFGTGNASLPLFNGIISILCVGLTCALLIDLLKIRSKVFQVLMSCLMISFPVMAVLFSYMFTSHPYMIGLFMMALCAYLICKETPWWVKVPAIMLGSASIGIYQAFIPVLLAILLIYNIMKLIDEEDLRAFWWRAAIQVACTVGVILVYFVANRFFLNKFGLELSSYQGIDQMGVMSIATFLKRLGRAYLLFFFPAKNTGADMYPGTLQTLYWIMLTANGMLAVCWILKATGSSLLRALLLAALFALVPLACNFIYIMSEDVHGLMVFGQVLQTVLLIAQLDKWESVSTTGKQIIFLAASILLATTSMMYARFDNQCYLKDTLQQQEATSYYTTLITQIKSMPGYQPDTEVAFVNDLTLTDPTIYDLEEMSFIRLNMFGHNTTEYIHYYKEVFMQKWCGFNANWYWGEDLETWPEVQKMPEYPADGSIQIVRNILIVKF